MFSNLAANANFLRHTLGHARACVVNRWLLEDQ